MSVDAKSSDVKVCGLKRSQNYGSKFIDEKPFAVRNASLGEIGKMVRIDLSDLAPTWSMEIRYRLKGADGLAVTGTIHNTILGFER